MVVDIAYAGRYRKGGDSDTPVELPDGLDPVRHRIICEHFFGFRPVGDVGRATTAVTSDQDCEVFACPT